MRTPPSSSRLAPPLFVAAVGLVAASTVAAGTVLAAPAAQAAGSATRTGTNVNGYCSSPSGFVTNARRPVGTLRMTVSPSSPRAGAKVTIKVFVKQKVRTPPRATYPREILQGQVVVRFGSHSHVLLGPVNKSAVGGSIFAKGWTAQRTVKAPAKGKRTVSVTRIVYNARGAFNGGWGSSYAGFDLVCSGGQNPLSWPTAFKTPKLQVPVRKA